MRIALLTILAFGIGLSLADPRFVTTTSAENVRNQISQLKQMRESIQLSSDEKEQLDNLWQEASTIEAMNERCGTISLTETLDPSCGQFYEIDLPKFETDYFKITGEIRLSATRLSNSIEQRRQAISQCYEALQLESFYPARFYTLEGDYSAEPLVEGVEISYDFSLKARNEVVNQLREQLSQWYNVCGPIILHSDNSGNLAPIFADLVSKSKGNAVNTKGNLYFEADMSYGTTILKVKSLNGIVGTYYLNGRNIFTYDFEPSTDLFSITINKRSISLSPPHPSRWKDKLVLSDQEVERGLIGRFVWSEGQKKSEPKPIFHQPQRPRQSQTQNQWNQQSYNANKPAYKSYGNDESDDGFAPTPVRQYDEVSGNTPANQFNITFQILGGVYMAFDEASSAKGFDSYYPGENDSISQFTPYLSGLLVFEFTRSFAIGIGGGIANNRVNYEFCNSFYGEEECDEENIYSSTVPVLTAELSLGEEINGGIRFNYIMDDDLPTYYLGGFIELANLVGIEIGWVHADDLWDNVYLGLTLRVPPRHFLERIKKNAEKNRNR